MEWHQKEEIILSFIKTIFEEIIAENPTLPIRVGARGGAEISDILEDKFVQKAKNKKNIFGSISILPQRGIYTSCSPVQQRHSFLIPPSPCRRGPGRGGKGAGGLGLFAKLRCSHIFKVGGAPKGQTKNPYDIYFVYEVSSLEQQLVWIDIKATNLFYKDSNPDMGTYKKFIKFFGAGNYFATYCQLAYLPKGEELQFVQTPQDEIVTVFLLKDIHHSFRIQPNNQIQVNYAAPSEPRSLREFIDLLKSKVQESL